MTDRSNEAQIDRPDITSAPINTTIDDVDASKHLAGHSNYHGIDTSQVQPGADAVYEAKISMLNEALIDIGMGPFQWKIFMTTGFGWFIDQLWMQAVTNIQPPVRHEFGVDRIAFLSVAKYAGLLVGASIWPMTADFIGRRLAFNVTLLITAVAGLVGAGMPTFPAVATLCAFVGFGSGGNQPVDSAIFLEYIPATHQNILVVQSGFWSLGQVIANMVAWPFIANFSCDSEASTEECDFESNLGWRYVFWSLGVFTVILFVIRFCFKIYETPKYLLGRGRDEKVVEVVHKIAARDGKSTWLSLEHFQAIDARLASEDRPGVDNNMTVVRKSLEKFTPSKFKALFSTPRMALSTSLILFLWMAIGLAFPLYNVFLPMYLQTRGVQTGSPSLNTTYRNLTIQALCGLPASFLGGLTVNLRGIGRKGTGCAVCLCTSLFLFLFTQAKTQAAVLGFSCGVAFFQNLTLGLLYAYTPELFPAPIRGTGNGLAMLFNRSAGLGATLIGAYVGLTTSVPIWISAALFAVAGLVFLVLPYESRGRAAS
ncbi:Ff.00g067320.m01.CDS01 [Fusarium sp. VM40]|nr:Ff.00g067320.m01.CDS01 [Fusarium sp. VM40]